MGNRRSCIGFFMLMFPLLGLFCRDVELIVEDAELSIPLEGALVRLWDGSEFHCDDDGKIIIQVPDDRQVTVRASYPGYESGILAVNPDDERLVLGLYLAGFIEGKELVIEVQRPGAGETRSGRSVAISGETLERSSRIGLIEDVMTSIKLLPGVGYTGMFNALPSIRGGDPGDLTAVLDGYYVLYPYHWGGGFSIFDPGMTEAARLSHGVFSTRYGHTISGLLEVTSKKGNTDFAAIDLGVSTSALNLNLSVPLGTAGGLMAMGKVTYWDPFIWAAQQLSKVIDWEQLDMVNAVTTAPYIRSAEISAHYRFNADLEWTAAAFIGADGVGADYLNSVSEPWINYSNNMQFNWDNLQAFFITGFTFNPHPDMVLKTTAGAGYNQAKVKAGISYDELTVYNIDSGGNRMSPKYSIDSGYLDMNFISGETLYNIQGKADFEWALGSNFLAAAGLQELYNRYIGSFDGRFVPETLVLDPKYLMDPQYLSPFYYKQYPVALNISEVNNQRFNNSAYILGEYTSPRKNFQAELGLRLDHLYFLGKDFSIQTMPVLNPRLNIDINILENRGMLQSLDLTLGTGLFSSVDDNIAIISNNSNIGDFTLKPNRSWTSLAGASMEFSDLWSFNLEFYFKYVFDRAYQYAAVRNFGSPEAVYKFNGDGLIWGFDAMLQKYESRYWDGWLSYTFTWAKYHESESPARGLDASGSTIIQDSGWYFPYFHRFHNLNLVLNFKPVKNFSIYTRLGLASGRPKPKTGIINSYPVELWDEDGNYIQTITKYRRTSIYDDDERTTWSIPWDLKLSFFMFNARNKVQTEIYLAAENLVSLFYVAKANTSFNQYTGREDRGSDSANYEMPIPMVSFGIKWSY